MGFLHDIKSKKTSIPDGCRIWYDSTIFKDRLDVYQKHLAFLVEADESLNAVPLAKYKEEMAALEIELFSLVWLNKFKREEFVIPQSIFTKRYLEDKGYANIWEIMREYNKVLSASTTTKENGESFDNLQIALMNKKRFDFAKKLYAWNRASLDDENVVACMNIVANRLGADIKRPRGDYCHTTKMLAWRFLKRVNINGEDINMTARERLLDIISAYYRLVDNLWLK